MAKKGEGIAVFMQSFTTYNRLKLEYTFCMECHISSDTVTIVARGVEGKLEDSQSVE